jgi:hypothetical protein
MQFVLKKSALEIHFPKNYVDFLHGRHSHMEASYLAGILSSGIPGSKNLSLSEGTIFPQRHVRACLLAYRSCPIFHKFGKTW